MIIARLCQMLVATAALALPALAQERIDASTASCPPFSDPIVIDPALVQCHARANPVPVVPRYEDEMTKEEREEVGRWIVDRLSNDCRDAHKQRAAYACAVIISVLPEKYWDRLPAIYVRVVYRVANIDKPDEAVIMTVAHNGNDEGRFGMGRAQPSWALLAMVRPDKCKVELKDTFDSTPAGLIGGAGSGSEIIKRKRESSCVGIGDDALYVPTLILSKAEAEKLFTNRMTLDHLFRSPVVVD